MQFILNIISDRFEAASKMYYSENYLVAASAASTMALLAIYYIFNVSQIPRVYTSNGVLRDFLLTHVNSLHYKYFPNLFYWEGRLQSVLGLRQRLPASKKLIYEREIFRLSDGGEVALDYMEPPPNPSLSEKRLLVLLFPGITSSSQTSYVKTLVLSIVKSGAGVIVMNNRGLGGVPITTPKLFCATATTHDLREVISHIRKRHPGERLMGIGTSLGGMLICKYLIEERMKEEQMLEFALVISTCWDAVNGTANLEKPFLNQIINYGVVSNLQFLTKKYQEVLEPHHDFSKLMACRSLREFDSNFTAPHFGYESAMDYYLHAQIVRNVHSSPVPVFALNAMDDPFSPLEDLPIKEAESVGSNLALIVTERGGHLGFLEGNLPFRRPFHFMERVVSELVLGIRLHGHTLKSSH